MRFGILNSTFVKAGLLAAAALLSACGFHLRSEVKLAPSLQRVVVVSSAPDSPLKRSVEDAMKRAGATLADAPGDGVAEIRLTGIAMQTLVSSVGANARVNEFNIVYHVDLEIVDAGGKTVLQKQPIEQVRSFTFDQTQAVGSNAEQDVIHREMERDMAQTVMRKIDSVERRLAQ